MLQQRSCWTTPTHEAEELLQATELVSHCAGPPVLPSLGFLLVFGEEVGRKREGRERLEIDSPSTSSVFSSALSLKISRGILQLFIYRRVDVLSFP